LVHNNLRQKKILFLGGAYAQIPIISEAKSRGFYIITCDYLPNNPGHKLADEYHNVSTTDIQGVLNLAKKVEPDFVVAYASDPNAIIAAYVSEELGLFGNKFESVKILSEKDLFRNFLSQNGFNAPKAKSFRAGTIIPKMVDDLKLPLIVKPTDSSGSRGVSKIENSSEIIKAADYAFSFSRNKRIIVEEFVNGIGEQLHGDGFVENGNLIFSSLGDHHYDVAINPFVPISTTWPSKKSPEILEKVVHEVRRVIQKLGFKNGPINIEARITNEDKVFIMEIGPRSGGNFTPQAICNATGFNEVKAFLDLLSGAKIDIPISHKCFSAYYVIHSECNGKLISLSINEKLKSFVHELNQYIKPGENVKSFHGANAAIGVLLMTFNSREEMDYIITNMQEFIDLKVEKI
jgi:carbamoylphosphate synthase large subunit